MTVRTLAKVVLWLPEPKISILPCVGNVFIKFYPKSKLPGPSGSWIDLHNAAGSN